MTMGYQGKSANIEKWRVHENNLQISNLQLFYCLLIVHVITVGSPLMLTFSSFPLQKYMGKIEM